MGLWDLCSRDNDLPFFCPGCGGQYRADHGLLIPHHTRVPEDSGGFSGPSGFPGGPVPVRPPSDLRQASPPAPGPGSRNRPLLIFIVIFGILLILVTGYPLLAEISSRYGLQDVVKERNSPAAGEPHPEDSRVPAVPVTTASPALTPPPVRIPPTFRVTPVPSLVPGVVSYPYIAGDSSYEQLRINYTFPFQERAVTVTVRVNKSVYQEAKKSGKAVVTNRKDIDRRAWAPGYFLAFVNDDRQEAFYTDLLSSFRNARQDPGLSDDEYLELITAFVQSLEYDTAAARNLDSGNRFPVETFVDGKGVCGDKSLLLAGLLSREGYDVALLLFDPEKHMAVGIRSSRDQYRNTSYVFLETTRLTLAGEVPDRLAGGIALTSVPQVIPVGSGWKEYFATPQARYILNRSRILKERIESLESRLKEPGLDGKHYDVLVYEHNRYVTEYQYINGHKYDRPGTYRYILANDSQPSGAAGTVPPSPAVPAFATCSLPAGTGCPAGSSCCEADRFCYAPCRNGTWDLGTCACRI